MAFPKSTEVNRVMQKERFYSNLALSPAVKEAFVTDIKRILWQNKLAPNTINVQEGEAVKEILVLSIELKKKNFNYKILEAISKANSHKVLYILSFEDERQLALFHGKLFHTQWNKDADVTVSGLNLDSVWENMVAQISNTVIEEENTLDQQLAIDEKRQRMEKEIARLEKMARTEKQPGKKFELVQQLNLQKRELEGLL